MALWDSYYLICPFILIFDVYNLVRLVDGKGHEHACLLYTRVIPGIQITESWLWPSEPWERLNLGRCSRIWEVFHSY